MAKRKRLTPPDPDRLDPAATETKSMFPLGVATHRPAAPIADVARDSSAAAALEEMTRSWKAARDDGRLVLSLPHGEIRLDHLHRDRVALDADDMAALRQSLHDHGQQTPIEVVEMPDGGYGLLSGWRRCYALRALHAETGEDRFATVSALLRRPHDAGAAYRTMVEENEIRANLSHYERARIVVKSVEAGVFDDDEAALKALFGAVPRARRSKIRTFLTVVQALEPVLRFPDAITERQGLDLARRLRDTPDLAPTLLKALMSADSADATAEQAVIADVLLGYDKTLSRRDTPAPTVPPTELAVFPGAALLRARDGTLVLSGPAITNHLQADLVAWLRDRLKG